jgi:hypothetical protein
MSKFKVAMLLCAVSISSLQSVVAQNTKLGEASMSNRSEQKIDMELGTFSVSLAVKNLEASRLRGGFMRSSVSRSLVETLHRTI